MMLKAFAEQEFKAIGLLSDPVGEMNLMTMNNIMELLEVLEKQGHSGASAAFVIEMFGKLACLRPLSPLTGEEWEWFEASPGIFQNKRYPTVFKDSTRFGGQAYDLNGIVWYIEEEDEDGNEYKDYFTNVASLTPIDFPYTPSTKYIKVMNEND